MKELIEKVLEYLPQYLKDFGLLVSGPKKFMAQKNTGAEDVFNQAVVFLGVSLVLVIVMTMPLLPPGKDLWAYVGARAIEFILSVTLYAVDLRLSWHLVGGKASIRSFFVTYAYFFSALIVMFTLFLLLSNGVFKVLAPDLYWQLIEAQLNKQPIPDMSGSSVPLISSGILVAGFILISVWGLISWGAYRRLNDLSKWRSFAALTISGILAWPIEAVVFFVSSAMMGK